MKQLIFVLALVFSCVLFAQNKNFEIIGTVIADDSQQPLESATVYAERLKDSSVVTYTISDNLGGFRLENSTYDDSLNVFVSYVGYKMFKTKVAINQESINLGVIKMLVDDNQLGEVLVKSRAPITVKKDTLEFNVSSFKTKKDATVEDLLKKLPGVEVDENGAITVNGRSVSNILVNGKPFFGDDPTITTRNLTKEIIEKVQIVDTKTKSEAFTGEESESQDKTINLTISEENNKGKFGRISGGVGTDERWETAGIINFFDNDRRVSVLAGGNNTNSPGFSFGEIQKMFGGANSITISGDGSFSIDGRSFGGGEGIVTSKNIGTNYADEFAEGIDISADYFYSESDSENEVITERENILPDSRFFTNSEGKSLTDNSNHSFNAELDIEVDSTFLINVTPSLRFGNSQRIRENFEETLDENNVLTNSSSLNSFVESEVRNFSNDVDITKRFGSKGSFLKGSLTTTFNNSRSDNFLRSEALIEDPAEDDVIRDQFTDGENSFNRLRVSTTYRLPIVAKKFFLDTKMRYNSDNQNNLSSTFDFDNTLQSYSVFNTDLSTDFEFDDRTLRPAAELIYRAEKWSVGFEAGYVFRTLENTDALRPELSLSQNFEALELDTYLSYRFNDKTSLYVGYDLRNLPPQLNQLQPFQDVSDPLNTITGNPNLEPANQHSIYANFNRFNFQKGFSFFGYFNLDVTNNQVVAQTTVDENFVRNTTYVNVDGNYNLNSNASVSRKIKLDSLRTFDIRLGVYGNLRRSVNFNNQEQFASRNRNITPNIRLSLNWKEVFEISPNYRVTFSKNSFNIVDFQDEEFISHNLRINTALFVPKHFEWRNDFSYSYNPNVASGFQRNIWFWNSTLAYSFLKDKATVTLKVYDLLNQNNNARRTANANFIQDSQSTVLQRFFMISLSYKFNSLGKKGEVNDGPTFFF